MDPCHYFEGVLRSFSAADGYGFVRSEELLTKYHRDAYISAANLPDGLSCGAHLLFSLAFNNKGQPQCRDVLSVDTSEDDARSVDDLLPCSFAFQACVGGWMRHWLRSARILSWNLLAPAYCSGSFFKDVDPEALRWTRRAAQIRHVLECVNAGVLCLQEIEVDRSPSELGLGRYACVHARRPPRSFGLRREDGCLTAWRPEDFELVRHQVISFDDHLKKLPVWEPYQSGNVALIVELKPLGSPVGWTILVANTHLAFGEEKEELRQLQLSLLLMAINDFGNKHVVLCGDLNSIPGSSVHSLLRDHFFCSVHEDAELFAGEDACVTASSASAHNNHGYAEIIDYCWVRRGGALVQQRLALPTRSWLRWELGGEHIAGPVPTLLAGGRWPSDHFPIAADLAFWRELPGVSTSQCGQRGTLD
eukprot:TRINITY_DN29380_c0_g1_i1.p1 TRINITY_DN29380_c0_g1~~TRINITY_DN29380_c0_g1_i1.p1  ORF type:complete len:420 (-),score=71.70 TRINITY_DN29380_c0_g1_i1:947-2206(-)